MLPTQTILPLAKAEEILAKLLTDSDPDDELTYRMRRIPNERAYIQVIDTETEEIVGTL